MAGRVAVRVKVPTGKAPSFNVFVLLVIGVVLIEKGIFVPTGKFVDPAVLKAILRVEVPAPGPPPAVLTMLMLKFSVPPAVVVKVSVVVPVTV